MIKIAYKKEKINNLMRVIYKTKKKWPFCCLRYVMEVEIIILWKLKNLIYKREENYRNARIKENKTFLKFMQRKIDVNFLNLEFF